MRVGVGAGTNAFGDRVNASSNGVFMASAPPAAQYVRIVGGGGDAAAHSPFVGAKPVSFAWSFTDELSPLTCARARMHICISRMCRPIRHMQTGARRYLLNVGSVPGGADVWSRAFGVGVSSALLPFALREGAVLYATVTASNK